MDALKIFKVRALPSVIEPSSLYLVGNTDDNLLEIYVSDKDGVITLGTPTRSRIDELISLGAEKAVREVLGQAHGVISKVYTFEPTLELVIPHNLNTVNFSCSIRNTANERVYAPDSVIDENTFSIRFAEPESGTLSVIYFI